MTNKVTELAGQALDKAVPYTWTTLNYDQIQELLACHAELIIRECMSNLYLNGYDDAMMQIKEDFQIN
jgi:hypothetical protein